MSFAEKLLEEMRACGPLAHIRAASLLAAFAGRQVYIPAESKAERRQCAAGNMLDSKMCGDEIAEVLRKRFGISARQAWRDIATVKAQRKMSEK